MIAIPSAIALDNDRSERIRESLARGRELLRQRAHAAWLPKPKIPPAEWTESRMRLDTTREATPSYDLKHRPWWRAILDAMNDAEVRSISLPAATQIGKTLTLMASILWTAENAPAPGMIVLPDRDAAVEFRDRLYGNAIETIGSGKTSRLRVPAEHLWNTRYIDLGSMRVYLAWSGSRQKLRGRPCRYVWLSEVDVYKGDKQSGDPISAAHQRTKAFFRGLHYHESSPVEYPSTIAKLERKATARYRWHCPCPQCGTYQELRFFTHTKGEHVGKGGIGGLKDAHGEYVSHEVARRKAFYICEQGCKIGNDQKQRMLERGLWVPLDCKVVLSAAKKPVPTIVGKTPSSRRDLGFHLWSIHSDSITFGDLAGDFIVAKETGKLNDFFGNWLGLEWKAETKLPSWSQFGHRMAWSHPRGTVPPQAWFLVAGTDVQGENNGVRCTVRAWASGSTSWLVDWFWLERQPGDENDLVKSDLRQLTELVLDRKFPIHGGGTNPLGKRELRVKLLTIDSNHLPMKVHHWMRSLPESWTKGDNPRVRAIRGEHRPSNETRWRLSTVESNTRSGEVYEGGLEQWQVHVHPFYAELTSKIQSDPTNGKPGAFYVTSDTLTLGKSYLEQVVNFARTYKVDEKTGIQKPFWGPINGRVPIDFWDCEIYSMVAANMVVGDLGWEEKAWAVWREKREQRADRPRRAKPSADEYFAGPGLGTNLDLDDLSAR